MPKEFQIVNALTCCGNCQALKLTPGYRALSPIQYAPTGRKHSLTPAQAKDCAGESPRVSLRQRSPVRWASAVRRFTGMLRGQGSDAATIGKDGFALPIELVTSTKTILARKRSGKSYTASVQAEELLRSAEGGTGAGRLSLSRLRRLGPGKRSITVHHRVPGESALNLMI